MEQSNEMPEKGPWSLPWKEAAQKGGGIPPPVEPTPSSKKKMPWDYSIEEAVQAAKEWFGYDTKPKPVKAPVEASKALPKPSGDKFDVVFASLVKAESRGQHTDAKGNLTTSGVGAKGITQVMRKTGEDPGYGVAPLKDQSEGEYIRFGKDYLKAMLNEFDNDYEKALAAYNAGVGNVKKAITKGGEKWKEHLPKKSETLPYIDKILGKNK